MDNRGITIRKSTTAKAGLGIAALLLAAVSLSGCIVAGPGRYHDGGGWNQQNADQAYKYQLDWWPL